MSLTVRATLRTQNAKMVDARKRLGLTMAHLSKVCRINVGSLYKIQGFRFTKTEAPWVLRLATALELSVEDLWDEELAGTSPTPIVKDFEYKHYRELMLHHVDRFSLPSGLESVEAEESLRSLDAAMARLPSRWRRILELRRGLNGESEHTLDEVAKIVGVCRERVRSLESQAMRRLESPMSGVLPPPGMEEDDEREQVRRVVTPRS